MPCRPSVRHDLTLEGYAFRLRPITDSDAGFVVELRSNPELNEFLHASSNRIEDQLAWQAHYYDRERDYYFVIERRSNQHPEGVIAIYDIKPSTHNGEWGRWILKPHSLAAVESVYLIYRTAFEQLGLDNVYCRTVASNEKVTSFHDSCGITARRLLLRHFELNGHRYDAIEHRVDRTHWAEIKPRLEKLSQLTARKIVSV
jgi:RimJ/RimL family protein N-acetyltransferase